MTTKALTPTQREALARVERDGALYVGNGVGLRTVRALEAHGLVTVTATVERHTTSRARTALTVDWTARPVAR